MIRERSPEETARYFGYSGPGELVLPPEDPPDPTQRDAAHDDSVPPRHRTPDADYVDDTDPQDARDD